MKLIKLVLIVLVAVALFPLPSVQAGSMFTSINNQGLTEGGTALSYTLKLSAKPSTGNNVSVTWTTNNECLVSHEGRAYVQSGQAVSVGSDFVFSAKATDDAQQEDTKACNVTYRTTSADSNVNNLSTAQTFTIYDNGDSAATVPALYTTVIGPSSITEASGYLYTFGVGPSTKPGDPLVITASTNDGQCELISGGQVANYVEQTIPGGVQGAAIFTVRTINDSDVEGDHICSVTHSIRTDDLVYSGMTITNTAVPIVDDEPAYSSEAIDAEELLKRPEFGLLDAKDANNDGTEDKQQPHVGVFINEVSGQRQAVIVTGDNANCNAVSTPSSKSEDQLDQQNDSFVYPHGLIGFRIICDKPGAVAKVTYLLDELYNTDNIEFQKFTSTSGYAKLNDVLIKPFETQNGPVSSINYSVIDGSDQDEDGKVDGIIHDPVGVAISETEPQRPVTDQINNGNASDNTQEIVVAVVAALIVLAGLGTFTYKKYSRKKSRKTLP